ncbi:MAG: nuclease-related domain-containing protein [Patescibacteria group bacterium]
MNRYTRKKLWIFLPLSILLLLIIEGIAIKDLIDLPSLLFHPTYSPLIWIIPLIDIVFVLLLRHFFITSGNFLVGAAGEDAIGKQLQRLSPNYYILENLVLNKKHGNIDFVVIGPKGVAVVEAKSHRGSFYFSNNELKRRGYPLEKDFVRQVKGQARELQSLLHAKLKNFVPVTPFIVFSSSYAKIKFGMKPLPGTNVTVVKVDWINNCIVGQKGVFLSKTEIKKIVDILSPHQQD